MPAEKMVVGAERRADVENTIASAPIVRRQVEEVMLQGHMEVD